MRMSKREIDSPLYSVPDAARYLHTDIALVREAIKLGYLPVFDLGSTKVYRPEMDKFIIKYMGAGEGQKLQKLIEDGKKCGEPVGPDERRLAM